MRIGINIPNELHRRLEPLRQHINISQICREAIEERLGCYEKALASRGDQDVAQAIERTWGEERRMRDIIKVDWGMLGCQDAKSWVTVAQLKHWDYLHHRQDIIRKQGRPPWEVPPPYFEGVKTFNEHQAELHSRIWQQDDQFFDWLYDEHGGIDREAAEREYMCAWLAYTDSAWGLFCEMRESYLENCRRKGVATEKSGPTPEVPEKLLRELEVGN